MELTNRLEYIEQLIREKKSVRDDEIVKGWKISSKQLKRYIDKVVETDRELIGLLKCKDMVKSTFRIPKPLKIKLNDYYKSNHTTQQKIVIRALYEFLRDK